MNIENKPIVRTIYKAANLRLSLFIAPASCIDTGSSYNTDAAAILYLEGVFPKEIVTEDDWKLRRYEIRRSNLLNVCEFFAEAVSWLRPESEVFLQSEAMDGLCLNPDKSDLKIFTHKGYFQNDILRATPAVIEVAANKFSPGIYLNINKEQYRLTLPDWEAAQLFGILRTFNFASEIQLSYAILTHSLRTNSFTTKSEYDAMRYNSGVGVKNSPRYVKW